MDAWRRLFGLLENGEELFLRVCHESHHLMTERGDVGDSIFESLCVLSAAP